MLMLLSGIYFIRAERKQSFSTGHIILAFLFLALSIGTNEMSMIYGVLGTGILWLHKQFIAKSQSKIYLAAFLYQSFVHGS